MSKRIVFVHGSPRKNGNTRIVANAAMEAAREVGAVVEEIDAVSLKHKTPGCIGCEKCHEAETFQCVIEDELTEAVASLADFDTVVFATPVYWWSYTAQMKIFIDRMYSLIKFSESGEFDSPMKGKTLALLATGGGIYANNLELVEHQLRQPSESLNCHFTSCLFPEVRMEAGAIRDNDELMEKGREFGRHLVFG